MQNYLITFIASILIWLMFVALGILWLIDGRVKKEIVIHALKATLVAWVITEMIKSLFPTSRPFLINGLPPLTITIPGDGAFPSSHAASIFALSFSVWLHDKKIGLIFILGAIIVGAGRVLANVHFPIDVTVGAAIGIGTAFLLKNIHFSHLLRRIKRK
jgi:undecaprenyl-diphosphatase